VLADAQGAHRPPWQCCDTQSLDTRQDCPTAQRAHCVEPPQSTPDSPLSRMPSEQEAGVALHMPIRHARPGPQTMAQPPQLLESLSRLAHTLPQRVCPAAQVVTQAPFAHAAPITQTLPHIPQFCGSELVSTHAPPQFARGAAQLFTHCRTVASQVSPAGQSAFVAHPPHTPAMHTAVLQSALALQLRPLAHGGHAPPPQSTSVSVPSLIMFTQDALSLWKSTLTLERPL
jgi:hypothetical protein